MLRINFYRVAPSMRKVPVRRLPCLFMRQSAIAARQDFQLTLKTRIAAPCSISSSVRKRYRSC